MISISGKEWKEYKIPKRLIDKYSNDFDISENLSKFYLARNFNKEDILIKEATDDKLNIFSKNKDFLSASPLRPSSTSAADTRVRLCPNSATTSSAVSASIVCVIVTMTPMFISVFITSAPRSAIRLASS